MGLNIDVSDCNYRSTGSSKEKGSYRQGERESLSIAAKHCIKGANRRTTSIQLFATAITCKVIPHALLKTPSIPLGPNASTTFCVRRKGTISGFCSVRPCVVHRISLVNL